MWSPHSGSAWPRRRNRAVLHRLAPVLAAAVLAVPASADDAATPAASPAPALLTLQDCYALALQRSETIAVHQEHINETSGRLLQALSTILPRASYDISERRQDGGGGGSGLAGAFTLREVPERKFVFSQPLFSGFKEFAALAVSRAERQQRLAEKRRAEQLLFVDVTDAFYLLLEQREDLAALAAIRQALTERLQELGGRQRLGRSRASETASAEAQLRRLEAEEERVRGQETTARQLLEFLTGLDQVHAVADALPDVPALEDEQHYAAKADARADVRADQEAWRVAQRTVTVSQAKFWPTVSVDGDYYTKRAGASAGVTWDVTLKVDVPLFQGGQVVGAVTEAAARARAAQLQFEQAQRSAALDIRQAYAQLQSGLARMRLLQQALEAAEHNYTLQREDYHSSLVSNLEVLQALQQLEDARRDYLHAAFEAKRLYWQLQVATGNTL